MAVSTDLTGQPDKQVYIAEFGSRRRITAASFYTGELERDPRYAAAYTRDDFYRNPSHISPIPEAPPGSTRER